MRIPLTALLALTLATPALADGKNAKTEGRTDKIIAMDEGNEIFMDRRTPEERDGRREDAPDKIIAMGDGEEI